MKTLPALILASLLWQPAGTRAQDGSPRSNLGLSPDGGNVSAREAGFVLERGAGLAELVLPRNEKLTYRAYIDLGLVTAPVGTVTQTSSVTPFKPSILMGDPGQAAGDLECATVSIHAEGDYMVYSVDSTIESRALPQAWPRLTHRQISEGTEKHRSELMLGIRDGVLSASSREDTRKGAPKGTRIWKKPTYRTVPEGTVDSLTAVFFARTLVRDDLEEIVFPLLDAKRVWKLTVRRGEERRMETEAGTFDVVEVVLDPEPYEGEEIDEKKVKRFEGLFGIHGSMHLWVDRVTGIAVRIEGEIPLGVVNLGVEVVLTSFQGTPPDFEPVKPAK